MPKQPIPANYARAIVKGLYGPATWANIMFFQIITPAEGGNGLTADDVGEAAIALYTGLDMGDLSDDWSVTTCKVLYRDPEDTFVKSVTVADASGTNSSGDQDAQVAYLINWVSDDARRGGKPRQYIPGVPFDRCTDSVFLDSSVQSNFNTAIASWIASLPAGGWTNGTELAMVEMSFVDAGVDLDPPVGYPITGGHLNAAVATQRRRVDRLRPA